MIASAILRSLCSCATARPAPIPALGLILFLSAVNCQGPGGTADGMAGVQALSPDRPVTTIAFGSCNDEDKPQPLWPVIAAEKPDLWIWTGDNVYADTEDPEVFRAKYDKQLANPGYRAFIDSVPFMTGTWDDHDYGKNDGGVEYPAKDLAKREMYRFLGVPVMNGTDSMNAR